MIILVPLFTGDWVFKWSFQRLEKSAFYNLVLILPNICQMYPQLLIMFITDPNRSLSCYVNFIIFSPNWESIIYSHLNMRGILLIEFLLCFSLCVSFPVRKSPRLWHCRLRVVRLPALSNTSAVQSRPGFAVCDSDLASPPPFLKRRVAVTLAHSGLGFSSVTGDWVLYISYWGPFFFFPNWEKRENSFHLRKEMEELGPPFVCINCSPFIQAFLPKFLLRHADKAPFHHVQSVIMTSPHLYLLQLSQLFLAVNLV